MVGELLLEPDVYQGLCLQPLSPGEFRHLLQYFMHDTHFVHATLQVHVKVHGYHVLFIVRAAVGVQNSPASSKLSKWSGNESIFFLLFPI
jgi:hypothetical protein